MNIKLDLETIMPASTSSIRVSNHNNWPIVELFQCEQEFIERLARQNIQQIFVTAKLTADDSDEPFNAAVGHILDCLDSLPGRPDAAFDSLYKVIDQNLKVFTQPGMSRMRATVNALFSAHSVEWEQITEMLSGNMPQQTADYAASRILDCYINSNPPHTEEVKKRAVRNLGSRRYEEFRNKFLVLNPQNASVLDFPYQNRRNAGRLMRMMFKQTVPITQRTTDASRGASSLDLSVITNLLTHQEKLGALMEICLATYRHERFHGEAFSPFRSSKAKLKTYSHAYFMLISAYVLILGMLQLQGKGGLKIQDVLSVANQSMKQFYSFFGSTLDE